MSLPLQNDKTVERARYLREALSKHPDSLIVLRDFFIESLVHLEGKFNAQAAAALFDDQEQKRALRTRGYCDAYKALVDTFNDILKPYGIS